MYLFFHLLTGFVLGFLLSEFLDDRRWLFPCIIGAILPDLIDKPLGYFFFPVAIGYGRIYSHALIAAILILVLGIAIWKMKGDPGVLGVGIGVLSHQILDLMWLSPSNWYYPLLGQFVGSTNDDYFRVTLVEEITNPFELVLAFILGAALLAFIWRNKIFALVNRHRPVISRIASAGALLLCVLSGIIIGWGIAKHTLPVLGWSRPEELVIGGVVIALSALLLWRLGTRCIKE